MTRTTYATSQSTAAASRPGKGGVQLPTLDPCLIVILNRTTQQVSLSASSDTPAGSSFLDSLSIDLEPEGSISFTAYVANDLTVDFLKALTLSLSGNEIKVLPGHGLRQKMTRLTSSFPAKYLLVVEVEKLLESVGSASCLVQRRNVSSRKHSAW